MSAKAVRVKSTNSTTPSNLNPGYAGHQRRLFRLFIRSSAVFACLMTAIEWAVRGPMAWQTHAFFGVALVFVALALRSSAQNIARHTIVGLGACFFLCMIFEANGRTLLAGPRVVVFAFPVAAALLIDRRIAVAFYFAAFAETLIMAAGAERPDGSPLIWMDAFTAVFAGGILFLFACAFDNARLDAEGIAASRQRDLEKALAVATAAADTQSRFLANMSHEIRTPMNGVLGLSRLLAAEPLSPSQRELAETVVANGESLLHILDDILDLSKLNADALQIAPTTVEPESVARQVVALLKSRARDNGTQLALELERSVPAWVTLDGHRLRQVLTNLVGNAIKFTAHGEVLLRVRYDEGTLRCEIQDTGIGIDPQTTETLFRPFVQAESGTARRYGGTGLGLAICKQLCELMGGRIGVESMLGVGSTFWFELPAKSTTPPVDSTINIDTPLRSLRVLVAEDNRVNQMVIRRFLDRLSAEVFVVGDGAQAVQAVQEGDYDVILMDRHMPGTDGLEATRRIRSLGGKTGQIPIIALTASVMAGDRTTCLQAGMDAILPKPVELESLKKTLSVYASPASSDAASTEDMRRCVSP